MAGRVYTVGVDWPDHFYATNALWPVPADWTHQRTRQASKFRASNADIIAAHEMGVRNSARTKVHRLKDALFLAILEVRERLVQFHLGGANASQTVHFHNS